MEQFHGTTIISVRRGDQVCIGGDGQVTLGNTVMKGNARKVRRLYQNKVLAGFAGGTADAFTLFERFDAKLEKHQGNLTRAAVELAKDWRQDRMLRRLEAILAVDKKAIKFEKDKLEAMGGDAAQKKVVAEAEKAIAAQVKKLEALQKSKGC